MLLKAQITITAVIILAIIVIAIAAPLVAPYSYDKTDFKNALSKPTSKNLMGTDQEGRDLLSRVIYGSRVSITVALGTALIALVIGTLYGAISGYLGGKIDEAMMRLVDIFYSLPDLLLIVLLTLIIGRGVLGIGAREAIVYLTEKREASETVEAAVKVTSPAEVEAGYETKPEVEPAPEKDMGSSPKPSYSQDEILEMSREVLAGLLERMHIKARIDARIAKPKFSGDEPSLILDIQGKDLGFLIGRKGETLAAIQHLTRLIVNKAAQQRSNLIVDVGGYKIRRERALKKLALRIADQATRRNRRIALEPMNAYERRIIHLTLRNHPTVVTESVGERERRKVTILPKDQPL